MTVDKFFINYGDNDENKRLLVILQHFSGNIPGTDPFCKYLFWEFHAKSFYYEYMEQCIAFIFHTGGVYNFHKPYLHVMMANYVSDLD